MLRKGRQQSGGEEEEEGELSNLRGGGAWWGRLEVEGGGRIREGQRAWGLERDREGKRVDRKISCNRKWGLLCGFERGIVVEKTPVIVVRAEMIHEKCFELPPRFSTKTIVKPALEK